MFKKRRAGFTIAEVLVASIMLALVVAAVGQAVAAAQMQSHASLRQQQAASLLDELMEEVLAHPYIDPQGDTTMGPDTGESGRLDFDAADDYHGFTESAGALYDAGAELLPAAFQLFSRSVSMVSGTTAVSGFATPVAGLTITVTVQDQNNLTWTTTRFMMEP